MASVRISASVMIVAAAWATLASSFASPLGVGADPLEERAFSSSHPEIGDTVDGRARSRFWRGTPPTVCLMDECPKSIEEPVICLVGPRGTKELAERCERNRLRIDLLDPPAS